MRTMIEAFNEWQDRYINDPEKFEREFQTVNQYLKDKDSGQEPSYGVSCSEYLSLLMNGTL